MDIQIETQAQGGNLIVYVINSNNAKILTVRDNGQGSCNVVPGYNYRIEFHLWGPDSGDYSIQSKVNPANAGFLDLNFQKHYNGPHQDMGGYPFTLNINI